MLAFDWPTLIAAALIVTLAYSVYGLTGFGAVIVGVPLLAHFFPLRFAVPMMLIFDLGAGLLLGLRSYRLAHRAELIRLIPYLLIGMVAGGFFLAHVPEPWLLMVLGIFVLSYSVWSLLVKAGARLASPRWAISAGLVGGAFTAMYGTGGPIYVIYLARRLKEAQVLRATIGVLIFGTALFRLVMFAGSGFYAQDHLLSLGFALLPCVLIGYLLGSYLHTRIPVPRVVQAVWLTLILSGASLIWRSLTMW